MAIRVLPDPVLRMVCAPVTAFDQDLARLAQDMFETMYDAPGRGLAAPQVGILQRLFVMDAGWKTGEPTPQVFVNPVILSASEDQVLFEEACLSIPGRLCSVMRPGEVAVQWHSLDREPMQKDFGGFEARCIQHELDHLDGVLCIDHVASGQEA